MFVLNTNEQKYAKMQNHNLIGADNEIIVKFKDEIRAIKQYGRRILIYRDKL